MSRVDRLLRRESITGRYLSMCNLLLFYVIQWTCCIYTPLFSLLLIFSPLLLLPHAVQRSAAQCLPSELGVESGHAYRKRLQQRQRVAHVQIEAVLSGLAHLQNEIFCSLHFSAVAPFLR